MPSPSTPLESRFSVDEVTPVTLPGLPAEKETDRCAYSVRGAGSVASLAPLNALVQARALTTRR
jgi:hypothetical protein